jgi:hypothetical protein
MDMDTLETRIDKKTGFPMVWVEDIRAYIHWLPVTKVQIEYFLCDTPVNKDYNESWYNELIDLNGRVSPKQAKKKDYWQLFLTGIKPEEAQYFAEWCGEGYRLPTVEEWNKTYRIFKDMAAVETLPSQFHLTGRASAIVEKINEIGIERFRNNPAGRMIVDQMVMRYGVMEWVEVAKSTYNWGGMGQTDAGFQSMIRTPENGTPEIPRDVKEIRLRYYGFRLIYQE